MSLADKRPLFPQSFLYFFELTGCLLSIPPGLIQFTLIFFLINNLAKHFVIEIILT